MGLLDSLARKIIGESKEKISQEEIEEAKAPRLPSSINEVMYRHPGSLIISLADQKGPPTPDNLVYLVVNGERKLEGSLPYPFDDELNSIIQGILGNNRVVNAIPIAEKGYIAVSAEKPEQSFFKKYLSDKFREEIHAGFRKTGAVNK